MAKNFLPGKHFRYCELRDGLRGPFQSQTGKKILPEAGTYIIVNWEIGWGGPFKGKKAKNLLPATGTYIIVNWERGWRSPFKGQNGQKKSACGRQLSHFELKVMCLSMCLIVAMPLWIERESPLSSWNLTPYPFRPKAHPLLEARRLV